MANRTELVIPRFRPGEGLPRLEEFEQAVKEGWLSARTRTTADGATYRLYNYTRGAQYERHWTPVTLCGRGLIVCLETGEVIAAPLAKFFNLGEPIAEGLVASVGNGAFEALVKMDGSLGIGYRFERSMSWATRGSFDSPQSIVAQAIWDAKYKQHEELFFTDWLHVTPMVEIIHPDTRVVVRYRFEDLVMIAARNRFTGEYLAHDELAAMADRLGMPLVERIHGTELDTLLERARELDGNNEGFVLHWLSDGHRVKVKGVEYMRLHRLLSGITPAYLAQCWYDGTMQALLAAMPEEFREESEATLAALDQRVAAIISATEAAYAAAPQADRKAFAGWVKEQPRELHAMLFVRHHQSNPGFPQRIASDTLATLVDTGRLDDILPELLGDATLAEAFAAYEREVSDLLWTGTRSAEARAGLSSLIPKLPKSVRGELAGAIDALHQETVVAKLRSYVQQKPEFRTLDVEALFAAAPSPESPSEFQKQWVFSSPLELRPFLDRWRQCGRRDTANTRARRLLSAAIQNGALGELVAVLAPHSVALPDAVRQATEALRMAWEGVPQQSSAAIYAGTARGTTLTRALLDQCWSGARQSVRDAYIEENKGAGDRFEDA